jgi:hypothetical protein
MLLHQDGSAAHQAPPLLRTCALCDVARIQPVKKSVYVHINVMNACAIRWQLSLQSSPLYALSADRQHCSILTRESPNTSTALLNTALN